MIFKNFLTEKSFKVGIQAASKEDIIKEIAAFFASQYGMNEKSVFTALWNREKKGSTGLGKGLAVPHARMPGLESMKLAVFLCKEGRNFEAYDALPTRLFFAAIIQEDAHPQEQLDMLRLIVETAEKTDLMSHIDRITTAQELRELIIRRITEAESQA